MSATQMTVNPIPIYIEIGTVSCFDSLCRPLKRAPIFLCCNRGVTHAPLKRGGSTPSLRLYRPKGLKISRSYRPQVTRQSPIYRAEEQSILSLCQRIHDKKSHTVQTVCDGREALFINQRSSRWNDGLASCFAWSPIRSIERRMNSRLVPVRKSRNMLSAACL